MIPTESLLDPFQWGMDYVNFWSEGNHPHGGAYEFFKKFSGKVAESFRKFQLPVIELDKHLPREAVCVVFDKVNTGGVVLTTFELLTAMLAAEGFNLREDWDAREQRIREYERVLSGIDRDQFIRTVALLVTNDRRERASQIGCTPLPAIACRRSEILSINREEYKKWAGNAEEGFKRAARFLTRQSIFHARDIPYMTQVTSLSYIFAAVGDEIESANAQRKLERWFWSGNFGEVYGGPTETIMANDAQQVPRYLLGDGSLQMLDEVTFEPARLLSMRTRNTAAYKGINALLMKKGAADWRNNETISVTTYYDDSVDIHHIFPKRWCENEAKILLDEAIPSRIFNSAINKTPLSARTNRVIGGRAPSEYIERLRRHASGVDFAIPGHQIDLECLRQDDFPSFFVARGKALMKLISEAIGKELSNGEEVFANALETVNLRVIVDEYDDDEEDEILLQAAG